jgi:hypothetical protein
MGSNIRHATRPRANSGIAFRISRRFAVALTAVAVTFAMTSTSASATPSDRVNDALAALWQTVFQTPTPTNPFAGGDPCVHLGRTLAPFTVFAPAITCTATTGTPLLVTSVSSECSTGEAPPFHGDNEAQLRACAIAADAGFTTHTMTLDGTPVLLTQAVTGLIPVDLPADNILGVPAQHISSVAHGWAVLLHPLTPGTHTIVLHLAGTDIFNNPVDGTNVTTIVMTPGH